jgi:hypothetical protein
MAAWIDLTSHEIRCQTPARMPRGATNLGASRWRVWTPQERGVANIWDNAEIWRAGDRFYARAPDGDYQITDDDDLLVMAWWAM